MAGYLLGVVFMCLKATGLTSVPNLQKANESRHVEVRNLASCFKLRSLDPATEDHFPYVLFPTSVTATPERGYMLRGM
ncbi:hypothetical protein F4802DRAFT_553354 [Xylaria palmicola]|nr:hypothetical protein F4802DRAFT_553354 [Xylaria palmicola]